ncbi:MAG TPA: hypothetical protein VGS00_03435 [Thermoanaerobaculia bacterium]|nr:hypothetical protein [Thermoanaerobaculia bacterium]
MSREKIVPRAELLTRATAHRSAGRRIVFANGAFDLLHAGHVHYLERDAVAAYGGRTAIVGDPKNHATTDLLARIRNR